MKRVGNLWNELISFENLLKAAQQSARGKITVGSSLWYRLPACDLTSTGWKPMPLIFRTMLTQILAPLFERTFVTDSYACRVGKGTHAAVRRAQRFAGRFRYVLKADIRKFFPSIDELVRTCNAGGHLPASASTIW